MEWPLVPLERVAQINPRDDEIRGLPDETPVSFVPMQAVSEETASITEPVTRSLAEVRRGYTPFQEGDLLFAKITPCMENGKCAIARSLVSGLGFGSTEFHVIRAGPELVAEFLYFYVRQHSFRAGAKKHMRGGVGQQRVPEDFLRNERIPLPPLSEQRRIVEILDQADRLRRLRAEADAKADRILPALFIKMFGDPGTNPMGWDASPINQVCTEIYRYPSYYGIEYEQDGVPEIRGELLRDDGTIETDRSLLRFISNETAGRFPRTKLDPGDLVMSVRGTIGKLALVPKELSGANITANLLRIAPDRERVLPEYLYACLTSVGGSAGVAVLTTNTTIQTIKAAELKRFEISVPPRRAQHTFARQFKLVSTIRQQTCTSATHIERLMATLLQRAFSGELTSSWREAHMKELLQEMQHQAKALGKVEPC